MILETINDIYNEKFGIRMFQFVYKAGEEDSLYDNTPSEFSEYDLKNLPKCDALWFDYRTGSYSGSGCYVGKVHDQISGKDKWFYGHCSHCSCYGPCESPGEYGTLEAILKSGEGYITPEMIDHIHKFIK